MVKKFWFTILIFTVILIASSFSGFVSGLESTHSISAVLRKEVDLDNDLKFDMFLRSSVEVYAPERVTAGENATWVFGLTPATIMVFLEIPSIDQIYAMETEIPIEDSRPISVFEGITLVIDLMPSTNLLLSGPARSNQTNFVWENFLDKQSFETIVFANASSKEKIVMNSKFYLDAKISVYIQLQNYNSEIIGKPIPQIEMSPQISRVIDIESSNTLIDTLGNPLVLIAFGVIMILIIVLFLTIKKLKKKGVKKEIIEKITEQKEAITKESYSQKNNNFIYCIYCGEELPIEALYCRKCGKAVT